VLMPAARRRTVVPALSPSRGSGPARDTRTRVYVLWDDTGFVTNAIFISVARWGTDPIPSPSLSRGVYLPSRLAGRMGQPGHALNHIFLLWHMVDTASSERWPKSVGLWRRRTSRLGPSAVAWVAAQDLLAILFYDVALNWPVRQELARTWQPAPPPIQRDNAAVISCPRSLRLNSGSQAIPESTAGYRYASLDAFGNLHRLYASCSRELRGCHRIRWDRNILSVAVTLDGTSPLHVGVASQRAGPLCVPLFLAGF